jgi:translation initiation factor IF-3
VGDNVEQGIFSIYEALEKAEEKGLDLVEISPKANPPVCKIIDFNKFLYQKRKKEKELKSKQSQVELKEIRFTPNTEEHDFNFKLNHAKKFLEEGNKIKAYVFFRGRSIVFKEQGEILLLKLAKALEDYGKVESMPKMEGNRMNLFIAPQKTKK